MEMLLTEGCEEAVCSHPFNSQVRAAGPPLIDSH